MTQIQSVPNLSSIPENVRRELEYLRRSIYSLEQTVRDQNTQITQLMSRVAVLESQ